MPKYDRRLSARRAAHTLCFGYPRVPTLSLPSRPHLASVYHSNHLSTRSSGTFTSRSRVVKTIYEKGKNIAPDPSEDEDGFQGWMANLPAQFRYLALGLIAYPPTDQHCGRCISYQESFRFEVGTNARLRHFRINAKHCICISAVQISRLTAVNYIVSRLTDTNFKNLKIKY